MKINKELKKIPINEVIRLFQKDGIELTQEEAQEILDFISAYVLLVIDESFDL